MTSRSQLWLRAVACAALLWAPAAAAQTVDLGEYEEFDVDDLPERHQRWLEQEVVWIITNDERDVFLRLDSDERRDDFMERFWAVRDPSPGTERNEYRELHYSRQEEAEAILRRLTPRKPWQTDMGRMVTLLGEPQSRTRLPNTSQAVPIEIWFYSVDPAYGTPPFFYLIFFQDRGIGEYRLYSPAADGPARLLNAAGQAELQRGGGQSGPAGMSGGRASMARTERERAVMLLREIDRELGDAAASLIPGEMAGAVVSPLRSEMVLSRVFEIPTRLMPRPIWAFRALAGQAAAAVRFETLPMTASAHVLFDPAGIPFVHYATRAPGDRLNLNNYEDEYYVTFDIAASLRDDELRVLSDQGQRTLQADVDAEAAARLRAGPLQYVERMPVPSGDYTLDLVLENNVSRQFGRATFDLHVPDLTGDRIDAAPPVLAIDSADLGEYEPFGAHVAFQVGSRVLIPAAGGVFSVERVAHIFWQVFVPAAAKAPFEVVYELRDPSGQLLLERRIQGSPRDRSQIGLVELATELDLRGFEPGEYEFAASIVGYPELRFAQPVSMVAEEDFVRPYVHAQRQPPALSVETTIERARQQRTLGHTDEAIGLLAEVLRRDAGNEAAFNLQVELLTDGGRNRDLVALVTPRLVESPNDADMLLLMGRAHSQLAEHYDAIRYYERARLARGEDTPEVLNPLASEYFAEGDVEKARALFEKSLELDPEQPEIRRLLDEVVTGQ